MRLPRMRFLHWIREKLSMRLGLEFSFTKEEYRTDTYYDFTIRRRDPILEKDTNEKE
jgi:hypothetical protein